MDIDTWIENLPRLRNSDRRADIPEEVQGPGDVPRRSLSRQQSLLVERMLVAAEREAAQHQYKDISVRSIAKNAGIAPASAYNYFSDKDHILAAALWHQMFPFPAIDTDHPREKRVFEAVRGFLRDPTNLNAAAVYAVALASDSHEVRAIRERIHVEIRHRLGVAFGTSIPAPIIDTLHYLCIGLIFSAGLRDISYSDSRTLVFELAALIAND